MGAYKDVHDTINRRTSELVSEMYDFENAGREIRRSSEAALRYSENAIRLSELHKLMDIFHTTVDWGEKE